MVVPEAPVKEKGEEEDEEENKDEDEPVVVKPQLQKNIYPESVINIRASA
jgi:hypothetical protein